MRKLSFDFFDDGLKRDSRILMFYSFETDESLARSGILHYHVGEGRFVGPRVWLDAGTDEDDGSVIADLRLLRELLIEKGWREGDDLRYCEVEGAGHNELAWGARFGDVLRYLFPA